jgi:maltoporin
MLRNDRSDPEPRGSAGSDGCMVIGRVVMSRLLPAALRSPSLTSGLVFGMLSLLSAVARADDTSAPVLPSGPGAAGQSAPAPTSQVAPTSAAPSAPANGATLPAAPTATAPSVDGTHPSGPNPGAGQTKASEATSAAGQFEFGSYGRVRIASDLRGGTGRLANVVAYGTRIDEDSYAELEVRRHDTWTTGDQGIRTRVVATLALFPGFFHFTGRPDQAIGVRNLYAQANAGRFNLWVGSRMYRGDDIYLLNWWPLDNQNTVGGGVGVRLPPGTAEGGAAAGGDTLIAFHVGMQRLDNIFQTQTVQATAPSGFGVVDVFKVDRPRLIESLKITHFLRNSDGRTLFPEGSKMGLKVSLYGEAHQLSAGVQRDPLTEKDRALPSDSGFLIGAQVSLWKGERDTFLNLWVRHARGIAVYDPLSVPQTFANDYTTSGAHETLVAMSGNYEVGPLGLMWAGYLRSVRDASEAELSRDKYDEGTLVLRPNFFLGNHWGVSVEGSYQLRRYALINQEGDGAAQGGLTRFGVMPYFSPAGRGSFKRPQFRLVYALTARDGGARALYAREDVFSQRKVEHFLGMNVEWWFNSSSYP